MRNGSVTYYTLQIRFRLRKVTGFSNLFLRLLEMVTSTALFVWTSPAIGETSISHIKVLKHVFGWLKALGERLEPTKHM